MFSSSSSPIRSSFSAQAAATENQLNLLIEKILSNNLFLIIKDALGNYAPSVN